MPTANHSEAGERSPDGAQRPHWAEDELSPAVVNRLLADAVHGQDPSTRDFGERYTFRAVLGRGGQGVVVEAFDRLLERPVALKTVRRQSAQEQDETLVREARLSGGLEHPNIPPTYDLGTDETGSPFFVMRQVQGVHLDELLPTRGDDSSIKGDGRPALGRLRLLSIFQQVCGAIEYAHARGVLHLDIKPQNVRVGSFGEVFVLDWGFAARKEETPRLTGGTPIYIAPERLRGEVPDERADVYSLGVLLYRMLTGERPYEVSKLKFEEYRARFDALVPIPPRARDRTIPPELDAIVMKAVAKNREERYQSVRSLSQDLQRFLDGVPVSAYRTGPVRRMGMLIGRHRLASALVGALLLMLAITGLLVHRYQVREQERLTLHAAQQRRREAQELRARATIPYEKGRAFLEQTPPRLGAAGAFFSQALAIDPTFAEAVFERGKVHMRQKDYQEALADFRRTLSLKPSLIMAHYHTGTIHMDIFKDVAAAERSFQAMQEIDPDNEYSNLGLARLHILAERYQQALALCDKIEERNPSLIEVHYLRGFIYGKRGAPSYEPNKALAAYNEYLKMPCEDPYAYSNRGDVRLRLGDVDGALADYNAALSIDSDYVYSLNNRGWIYYAHMLDTHRALEDFNHAAAAKPDYHWTYMNRAAVYEFLSKWPKAEADYARAQELHPDDPRVLERRGSCALHQGKFEEAARFYTEALKADRLSMRAPLYHRRATARYGMGDLAAAVADCREALAAEPEKPFYPAMLLHLALLRLDRGPDPQRVLDAARHTPDKPWLVPVAQCWMGEVPPAQVLAGAERPHEECETAYYVGMYYLLVERDPPAARKAFEQCRATRVHLYKEYVLAGQMLAALQSASRAHP